MKMTMHIDEALLERVMKRHGCESKKATVDYALRELDRRSRLREFGEKGLGLTPDELGNAIDLHYNVLAMRAAEIPGKHGRHRPRQD